MSNILTRFQRLNAFDAFDAAKKGLDAGIFTEGHQLDAKLLKRVPKKMIGRRLTQDEATKLLANFE